MFPHRDFNNLKGFGTVGERLKRVEVDEVCSPGLKRWDTLTEEDSNDRTRIGKRDNHESSTALDGWEFVVGKVFCAHFFSLQ